MLTCINECMLYGLPDVSLVVMCRVQHRRHPSALSPATISHPPDANLCGHPRVININYLLARQSGSEVPFYLS